MPAACTALFMLVCTNKRVSPLINDLPGLKFIVVDTVSVSEDEEVVLFVTLAGFVLHIPVVLPGYLVIIPAKK